ncbi:unnamed protein product, partial [Musa acuminata var. zebrina]
MDCSCITGGATESYMMHVRTLCLTKLNLSLLLPTSSGTCRYDSLPPPFRNAFLRAISRFFYCYSYFKYKIS